jgi:hypothetical protein
MESGTKSLAINQPRGYCQECKQYFSEETKKQLNNRARGDGYIIDVIFHDL